MLDSANDGITEKIVYEGRAAKVYADAEKLELIDKYYDECAEQGSTQDQINKSIKDVATVQAIIGDPRRLDAIAEDFVAHYETRLSEGSSVCGKAMIVCMTRNIAFELYKRIVALRPEWAEKKTHADRDAVSSAEEKKLMPIERIKLVMTSSKDDPEVMADLIGNDNDRKVWAEQFKNPKSNFKVVVLVDMWLTGFDVPCLDAMYIDKPLQKQTLIQTISRVNRVYPGKSKGLVVDYIGFKKRMNLALKLYGGVPGASGQMVDDDPTENLDDFISIVCDELRSLHEIIYPFDDLDFDEMSDAEQLQCLNRAANYVLSTERLYNDFIQHSKIMITAYKICQSSDQFTDEERERVYFFRSVRAILMKLTKGNAPDVDTMNIRVRQLMEDALQSDGVEDVVKIVEDKNGDFDIFDPAHVDRISNIQLPNFKRKMLERLLRQQISEYRKVNKIKAEEFSVRLNGLLKDYNDRSDDAVFADQVMSEVTERITELIRE